MASACVYIECPVTHMILGVSRRDDPFAWGLPGGKVEDDESELECARRELAEETGVRLYYCIENRVLLKEIFRREGGVTYGLDACSIGDPGVIFKIYQPRAGETGRVGWVTVTQLLDGPFGDYNELLLKHIGRI